MNTATITPPKYPETMPITTPDEFQHRTYENTCGTQRCAVGWVAHSFGLTAHPEGYEQQGKGLPLVPTNRGWDMDDMGGLQSVAPVGSPMHIFSRCFAKHLGASPEAFDKIYRKRGLRALEDVFEEGLLRAGYRPTSEETSVAWNKAVRESGYTQVVEDR